ncbi:MAG TPA: glycosyltransferase, partial [Planctomycetes bacterium]|nr:glycosyltransferase [Planctomycetota bacterium]
MADGDLRFSLVIPIYNEEETVETMLAEVEEVLVPHGPFEALFVDDGSKDASVEKMRAFKVERNADWLRIVRLVANAGQSAAVMAGVEQARGPIIATLDGDMQNDPRDIPSMLERVESGECDAVVGVRAKRQDTLTRRMSSRVGNGVRNFLTGDKVKDAACGIKVIRRPYFVRAPRFVGMHRFMATLVRYLGGKVVEQDVNHRQRFAGSQLARRVARSMSLAEQSSWCC